MSDLTKEKVVVIQDGKATVEGLVLAAALYMGAVKDIFALRAGGLPYNECSVLKDSDALRAFDHLDACTKALQQAIAHQNATIQQNAEDAIELEEICRVLPGVTYMDPPDGGSVSRLEQFKRMAQDAKRLRALEMAITEFGSITGQRDDAQSISKRADEILRDGEGL